MGTFKKLAWNKVSFNHPQSWEIAGIGKKYLFLTDNGQPAMEIKWERIKGGFCPETQLKRLGAGTKNKLTAPLKPSLLPTAWRRYLSHFEHLGFTWRGKTMGAAGCILYCRHCRHVTLIQFFMESSPQNDDIMENVVKSFRDHPKNDFVNYRIYDLILDIRHDFHLQVFCFHPGIFRLEFRSASARLAFRRWAPASLLLKEIDLKKFAAKHCRTFTSDDMITTNIKNQKLCWESGRNLPGGYLKKKLSFNKYPGIQGSIRHLEDRNRILGVELETRGELPPLTDVNPLYRYETI